MLDLIFYELWMLNQTACYSPKNEIEKNMRLESFLVHARNLIDFLEGCCQKDDVRSIDFLDKNKAAISPILIPLSTDLKNKINKHCQHLTKTRLDKKIGWSVIDIAKPINEAMARFINQLQESYSVEIKTKINHEVRDFLAWLEHKQSDVHFSNPSQS